MTMTSSVFSPWSYFYIPAEGIWVFALTGQKPRLRAAAQWLTQCGVRDSSRGLTSQLTVSFINEPKQEPPSFKFAAVANDASGRIFTWQEIAQI